MTTTDRIRSLVAPLVTERGLELYDLEQQGGVVRVLVDREGGVGIDDISALTRSVSRALDDADPISGRYTLEVSSPGLERPLRTPAHFRRAVGETVIVKTLPGVDGDRRVRGTLVESDDRSVVVGLLDPGGGPLLDDAGELRRRRIAIADVERARTVFEWGPAPKPGGAKGPAGPKHAGTPQAGTRRSVR